MERDGSLMVQDQECKEDVEGFHIHKTELLSDQHTSYELERCPSGVRPFLFSMPQLSGLMVFGNFFRSKA